MSIQTNNYKYKIENNLGGFSGALSEVTEVVKKHKKKAIAGALGVMAAGLYQVTKTPEISIESTTTIIQAEINKVAKELTSTKDEKKRTELQNIIDELAKLRAKRNEIVEAASKDPTKIADLIKLYREANKPVVSLLDKVKENKGKYTDRTFYKNIKQPDGTEIPVYISEGHKELIRDVMNLINQKKITFPANYNQESSAEKQNYGVNTERERHIKFIEDGRVPVPVLHAMKEIASHFEKCEVASTYRSFSTGGFKGSISPHPIAALDITSVTFKGTEGKPITITALNASAKNKNKYAIYAADTLADIARRTKAIFQLITSDNVKDSLKDEEGFSTTINDPKSGKTLLMARKDHENHFHFTFNYQDPSFSMGMSREDFNNFASVIEQRGTPNYRRLVAFLKENNIPTIFENPNSEIAKQKPIEQKDNSNEVLSRTKITRNTSIFEKYMKNGSDLSSPGFIEAVEAMSERIGADPNVVLAVFAFESGIDHTRKNPTSSATGFIQIMDYVAFEFGITTKELREMTALEQLKYVERYFVRWSKITGIDNLYQNPVNVYTAVAAPGFLKYENDKVIYRKDDSSAKANPGWDANGDGEIQKGETFQAVKTNKASGGFLPNNRSVGMQAPKIGK